MQALKVREEWILKGIRGDECFLLAVFSSSNNKKK